MKSQSSRCLSIGVYSYLVLASVNLVYGMMNGRVNWHAAKSKKLKPDELCAIFGTINHRVITFKFYQKRPHE